ncbi:hypothetical protein [uncultured Gimesia sp.]|uniref:DUF6916 family protein n=1 Tax=uncultured Gimesia sp. TaxID=1678688 RepID=UPI00263188C7|nr:hypothetical protein [uncultured Gimesia sp.]
MQSKLTKDSFDSLLNSEFRVQVDETQSVKLQLIEVTPLEAMVTDDPVTLRGDPFVLVFKGLDETALTQQIYDFEHEQLGHFSIFIVPISPDHYEAVFN